MHNQSKIALAVIVSLSTIFFGTYFLLPNVAAQSFDSISNEDESIFLPTLSLVDLFEKTERGVVSITVTKNSQTGPSGVGSGFVYDESGHIITNNHVVKDAQKIIVTFVNGKSFNAEVIGTDPFTDIAVIKINSNSGMLRPLLLGDSSKLRVGEQVAAIGNPFGLSGSMTSGIVSQLGRILPTEGTSFSIPDVIQTDAAINPGNSGGPLLNMQGHVIGINTAIRSSTGEFTGIGLSIPSKTVMKIVPNLIEDGQYYHPWIGITSLDVNPEIAKIMNLEESRGLMVITVVQDSPADKAGLRGSSNTATLDGIQYQIGGDVIISIDGKDVRKIDDVLIHLQREKNVGDIINLEVILEGSIENLSVLLEQRPE
jgi:S1-C subfamily serine protease